MREKNTQSDEIDDEGKGKKCNRRKTNLIYFHKHTHTHTNVSRLNIYLIHIFFPINDCFSFHKFLSLSLALNNVDDVDGAKLIFLMIIQFYVFVVLFVCFSEWFSC